MKILNKKEVNEILDKLKEQYDIKELKLDYVFLQNTKDKILITNREIAKIDLKKLRVDNIGLYFCSLEKDGIRLSIEGSQLIGKYAKKNVANLDKEDIIKWMKGEDININEQVEGYVVIKNNNDYFGTGKYKEGKILNFVSKSRRLNVINQE
ncbi:MAG TPA: hypothetical protein VJJ23_04025 [Candidatus Nanoarchaeia archaeon]|nr:hypothetical protein [Candidatus Nanoarchaeia archaeon]